MSVIQVAGHPGDLIPHPSDPHKILKRSIGKEKSFYESASKLGWTWIAGYSGTVMVNEIEYLVLENLIEGIILLM